MRAQRPTTSGLTSRVEPPTGRCVRAAVDARGEVLSKRRFLDQVVVGEVRAHPRAEHRRRGYANRASDLGEIVPEIVADAESRCAGLTRRRLDQDENLLLAAGPRAQTHAAGAAGAGDVDLDAGDAALGAIQVVQVLEQSIDVGWVRASRPGTRRARAHENRSSNKHEAERGRHERLAGRSRPPLSLQDRRLPW